MRDDGDIVRAKALMADYQAGRRERALAEQATAREHGKTQTFSTLLKQRLLYVVGVIAAMVAIVALTLALPYLFLR